jgi:hypothetical protein
MLVSCVRVFRLWDDVGSASRAVVILAATWNGNVDLLACFAAIRRDFILNALKKKQDNHSVLSNHH